MDGISAAQGEPPMTIGVSADSRPPEWPVAAMKRSFGRIGSAIPSRRPAGRDGLEWLHKVLVEGITSWRHAGPRDRLQQEQVPRASSIFFAAWGGGALGALPCVAPLTLNTVFLMSTAIGDFRCVDRALRWNPLDLRS